MLGGTLFCNKELIMALDLRFWGKREYSKIMRLIFHYLWNGGLGIRLRLAWALLFVVLTICLNMSIPLIFEHIINKLSLCQITPVGTVQLLLLVYGITWICSKITMQMREIVLARVIGRGVRMLSIAVFDHLQNLSLRFHVDRKTGVIATVISRLQRAFPDIFLEIFIFLLPTIVEIIIAVGVLWYFYSFVYGFLLFAVLGLYILFSVIGIDWSSKALTVSLQKEEKVAARMVDSLLNFETVQYFNNQRLEHEECNQALIELEDALTKRNINTELVHMGQGIIMGLGLLVFTWISGTSVLNGTMKTGDFVLINSYLLQFIYPLSFFGIILRHIRRGLGDMEEAIRLLELKPEIVDRPQAKVLKTEMVEITFDNVFFGYEQQRPILKGISFRVPAGKTVAIVGPTGSGKSTITRLLMRLYDVTSGRILINGVDVRDITQESLRALMGVVPQDTMLFNNTLYYNIAYGNTNASATQIEHAIQLAQLDQLLYSLPDGIETIVGERGLKLSGGEKQRVAIARVLVKAPQMYIFDEATSALDTRTEREIQKNIDEISKDSTTIIIAHRLSTVVNADHIVVLQEGHVAEQGTHTELLAKQGIYRRLWDQQTSEEE